MTPGIREAPLFAGVRARLPVCSETKLLSGSCQPSQQAEHQPGGGPGHVGPSLHHGHQQHLRQLVSVLQPRWGKSESDKQMNSITVQCDPQFVIKQGKSPHNGLTQSVWGTHPVICL